MNSNDFTPGLAGVVAFETEIAEPDREGGSLRYRGVDIEDLVGRVPFEQSPHLLERDPADEVLDVDTAVAKRAPLAVRLGDLRLEGDDACEAGREVVAVHERPLRS